MDFAALIVTCLGHYTVVALSSDAAVWCDFQCRYADGFATAHIKKQRIFLSDIIAVADSEGA